MTKPIPAPRLSPILPTLETLGITPVPVPGLGFRSAFR